MEEKKTYHEISEKVYWIGSSSTVKGLYCNSYLVIDEEEAVLIDPGPAIFFEDMYNNIIELISIDKIKYIVISHESIDVCASIPLLEKKGVNAKIATHWRTATLIDFYGINLKHYIVNENKYELKMKSGRKFKFIHTPYLNSAGSISTYDTKTYTLFSGEMFGGISKKWSLYAPQNYIYNIKTYHEHYTPSNEIIRFSLEKISLLEIYYIAPQHGSIIIDKIGYYIDELKRLQCGIYSSPIKRGLSNYGGYVALLNEIIKRYEGVFGKDEVLKVFNESHMNIDDETMNINEFNVSGEQLWELFFQTVYRKKGIRWITLIDPLIVKLTKEFGVKNPKILVDFYEIEEYKEKIQKDKDKIIMDEKIRICIDSMSEKRIRCPITGFFNENVFYKYLNYDLETMIAKENQNAFLIYLDIDDINKINIKHGSNIGDESIKNLAYLLSEIKSEKHIIFKRKSPGFAYYGTDLEKGEVVELAENIRNKVESSESFIEKITVSIGVATFNEIYVEKKQKLEDLIEIFTSIVEFRMNISKKSGMNKVVSESNIAAIRDSKGKILIADNDAINLSILNKSLINEGFEILNALDGKEALKIIEDNNPDLIICEIMIPKLDGLTLKEQLNKNTKFKSTPFMVMSHNKHNNLVVRAMGLEVDYYFEKPLLLAEIVGMVKKIFKGARSNDR
ncbi:response regulator [Clostridium grantii]|uniref:Stage 0 sporulation protein A homolog n=1 Tax=Clostridium grantii DSM 8605 TaxID=1121316 RepID=A0A1M5QKE6_9CLOT|nr:response regulator [Clostridium grantii]SHH14259.1 diguanylate cyclase (GGDEF) domain-containing protein [Clostridium grantii DSM 8605]